jgi:glycosyltransferase involved in cell wall biosynthesis
MHHSAPAGSPRGRTVRVCIVAPAYMTGGQAIEAKRLVDGFAADPDVRTELQPIDPRIPSWIAAIPAVRTMARLPLFYAGLVRRVLRADVVHVFTAAFWPFFLTTTPAILIGRLLGRPVILNYRDGRASAHLESSWVRRVMRRATVLVFPSGFLQALFRGEGLDGVVVPNVVDRERFAFRRRDPVRPVLISSRLLEALYAVENTIRAFALLRERYPDARLIVIGGGDREQALRDLVTSEGVAGVEFHGAVPHDAVAGWFDRADVFVNSSREDNMPHSIIEAFSSGLPVVTTAAGGIPYIVEHERNGLLVPCDDPSALAAALGRVLSDGALAQRLIREGDRDCSARYAWSAAKAEWVALYHRLAGGPPAVDAAPAASLPL